MTIRSILVPMDGSDAADPVLELGLRFGQALSAHVDVLYIRPDPKDTIPLLGEGMSVSMIEDMIRVAEQEGSDRASRSRSMFDDRVASLKLDVRDTPEARGPSAAWGEESGREDEIIARRGRLADLIVVGRPTASSDVSATLTLNAALFDTGRPVLVVPPGGAGEFGKNVAISWNGSPQSARAVGSALPLIQAAGKVTVMTGGSHRTSVARAPELVTYLQWHGVSPETRTFTDEGQPIGAGLLAECAAVGVDFLVMGAYTQSRMRQLIWGGVTRHVLEHATIPLLMAH